MKKINLFGILHIERSTDILAFAAFVISVGTLMAQIVNTARGPDIILKGPDIIALYSKSATDNKEYVRIGGIFNYLNDGSPGYDDFLIEEKAVLMVGRSKYILYAKDEVDIHNLNGDGKVLTNLRIGDIAPAALNYGTVVSREVEFIFFHRKNEKSLQIDSFIKKLEDLPSLKVKFIMKTLAGQVLTKECRLDSRTVLRNLTDKTKSIEYKIKEIDKPAETTHRGWSANTCN